MDARSKKCFLFYANGTKEYICKVTTSRDVNFYKDPLWKVKVKNVVSLEEVQVDSRARVDVSAISQDAVAIIETHY